MVLVRHAGNVLALEDRCAHRGAPLSGGRVNSRGLVCPYHGWTYGADGICREMPGAAAGALLPAVRIPALTVRERHDLVWVSATGDLSLPERIAVPAPAQQRLLWQSVWHAPVVDAQENFLDALHTHFVHPGLVREDRVRRAIRVTLKVSGDGFCIDYQGQPTQSGLMFRLFESERLSERAYFSGLGVAQLEYRYVRGGTVWITACFTPRDSRSTHVFATLHIAGRWAPRWLVRWAVGPFLRRVAAQDQAILERVARHGEGFPGRVGIVTAQDLARPYIQAAWEGRLSVLPQEVMRELRL